MNYELKHTPGPWRVGTPGPNGCYTVGTEAGLMTAIVAHSLNYPEQAEQAAADARLIAAAPDSHEANKFALMVLCALEHANDWHPNMQKDITFAIEANRAAIAKATGAAK